MTYTPPPHVTQHWQVTKPAATGQRGIVVSQSRDAAQAGMAILEAGGNAIDAAVAVALALPGVEPWNSGLGGIGFALVHRAGQAVPEMVDFGPVAPSGLDPSAFRLTGGVTADLFAWPQVAGDANIHGPLSCAIPSAVAGYHLMHERWGRLPLAEVIAPAVALAERGLPADWFTTVKIAGQAAILRKYPESARIYLPNGLPPVGPDQGTPGFFRLGRLADTLAQLQREGLRAFYDGDIAAGIAADVAAMGGVLSSADLAHCQARIVAPMTVPWRGGRALHLASGLTAGPTLAAVLADMRGAAYGAAPDSAWYVALAGSMKAAYAARLSGLGEADAQAAETCTTHITVCDAEGTMVAMTTTLLSTMGSRVVLPASGVLLNNGIMWFDPRPGQANSLAPGRRPLTNMCPIIMSADNRPVLAAGASGGRRIMASVFQMMTYIADFEMDAATAAHHPRIDVSSPDRVSADGRLPADVLAALAAEGATEIVAHTTAPANFACPNVIVQNPDGSRTGISDAMSPWSAAVAQ